jgi:hypothetical protein
VELIIGLAVLGLIMWELAKLTDLFEERSFVFWLIFYLVGGALAIMVLGVASTGGRR